MALCVHTDATITGRRRTMSNRKSRACFSSHCGQVVAAAWREFLNSPDLHQHMSVPFLIFDPSTTAAPALCISAVSERT